jgi:hypothetical protein
MSFSTLGREKFIIISGTCILRHHYQKNGLQSSDRRGICKNHGKSGSGRTWDWSEAILGGSGPVPCDGQGKPIENGQTGVRESFLGTTPA